jgi:hypothetical protein
MNQALPKHKVPDPVSELAWQAEERGGGGVEAEGGFLEGGFGRAGGKGEPAGLGVLRKRCVAGAMAMDIDAEVCTRCRRGCGDRHKRQCRLEFKFGCNRRQDVILSDRLDV